MSRWRHWRWPLRFLGLAIFAWVLSRTDVLIIVQYIMQANWPMILLSITLGLPFIWLKSQRWRLALQWTGSNLSSGVAFRLFSFGQLAGLATPGQLGDFTKAVGVAHQGGTLKSGITASVGDRALDFAILVGLSTYYGMMYQYAWPELNSLDIFLAVMVMIALLVSWLWVVAAGVLGDLPFSFRLSKKLLDEILVASPWLQRTILLAIYTLVIHTLLSIRLYLLLLALGKSAPVVAFISSMAVMSLITLLPISIAGIGSRDAVLLLLFGQFDISPETAIGFSFLVLLIHLSNAAMGTVAWVFHYD